MYGRIHHKYVYILYKFSIKLHMKIGGNFAQDLSQFVMDNDQVTHEIEEHFQIVYKHDTSDMERKGPVMQPQDGSIFLTTLVFACKAVIACAGQLDTMEKERGDGNCGAVLAHAANAIILAIKKGRILAAGPSAAFTDISQIIEEEVGDSAQGRVYSLFFDSAAKSFLRFSSDEQLTASTWLTVLTCVNKTLSKSSEISIGTMLDALIRVEHKLRDALDLGLNPVDAFGEVVSATETFALQTVHVPAPHSVGSTNHKMYKYPDPEAHAVGVWMRAAYEAVKLKYGCKFDV